MKNIFALLIITFFSFSLSAQDFEGALNIKTTYKQSAKDTMPKVSDFKMLVKGKKAFIDQKDFGRIILNTEKNELLAVLGNGTQPTVWKINLTTLNQLGGLLSLMKSITGQDVMNINAKTVLTATTTTSNIANYKSTKYTTSDGSHNGTVWVTTEFPYDLSGIWNSLNIQPALTNAGITKGTILKANSKSSKTGESNTMIITPKKQVVEDKVFDIPTKAQVMDITPLLTQMMQNKKPEEVQQMLQQMMPRK